MITISRSLLRQVRSVFRRAAIGRSPTGPGARIQLEAYSDGLRLRGMSFDAAVEYHLPGRFSAEQYILPSQFLEDCEGRKDEPVTLEASGNRVTATFTDGGVPQLLDYQAEPPGSFAGFPAMPEHIDSNEPRLLTALREAFDATDRESTRYALGCIQLRGKQGRLVATDGRQVYRHEGFSFPWDGDLLVRGSNVIKSSEFPLDQQVGIGQAGDWVLLVVGYWFVWLRIDKDGRFPSMDGLIPKLDAAKAQREAAPEDVEFLSRGLARLPANEDQNHPVTIDLNGRVAVRAKNGSTPHPTELVLASSRSSGEPLAISTDRYFLGRMLGQGFRELAIYGRDKPVLCDDGRRQYLWALLDPESSIPPDDQAVRVESTSANGENGHAASPKTESRTTNPRRNRPVETTNGSGSSNGAGQESQPQHRRRKAGNAAGSTSASPIQQAELLHASLRDSLHKTRELIVSLRRQKKQSRLVQTTLASLKQLQGAAG